MSSKVAASMKRLMAIVVVVGSATLVAPRAHAQSPDARNLASAGLCMRSPNKTHCDGLDPVRSGCSRHTQVVTTANVPGGQGAPPAVGHIYLLYSPLCHSKWAEYKALPTVADAALVAQHRYISLIRTSDGMEEDAENGPLWTHMLYAPLHQQAYSCQAGATIGTASWTGYTATR